MKDGMQRNSVGETWDKATEEHALVASRMAGVSAHYGENR